MIAEKKNYITIPNLLGFYRLFMFPVILCFILTGKENLFAIFLVINLLTDVADGIIARKFNLVTEFGARLDSMADNFTYLLAFTGIFVFKLDDFQPHIFSFVLWFFLMISTVIMSLIKFRRFSSFHLYSFKIGGYIQGFFFIVLFSYGFVTPLYYFMVVWGILASLEHITIQLIIKEMRSNAKGLYWILKEKNTENQQVDSYS
ncbi:MAG: CDP-alcohol phosphatidyltransferase family protein [Bacteroidales bacterium]|nr:CDP-alcohol phosphatidyltransferase family protein [Bacteroidales bacterium]